MIFQVFRKSMIIGFQGAETARQHFLDIETVISNDFRSFQKKSEFSKTSQKSNFQKFVRAYLTHFSFLHMASIYSAPPVSCQPSHWRKGW